MKIKNWALVATCAIALPLAACGGSDSASTPDSTGSSSNTDGGSVFVTGSSTVEPISIKVGELAGTSDEGNLKVTVEGPGTGDGFKKFCAGDGDVTGASRPIKEEEATQCADAGIEYVELAVAIDGLTVATSVNNTAIECLDKAALYALIGPESEGFSSWADGNTLAGELGSAYTLPDAPLSIYGPEKRAEPTTRSWNSPLSPSPVIEALKLSPAPTTPPAQMTTSSLMALKVPTLHSDGWDTPITGLKPSG